MAIQSVPGTWFNIPDFGLTEMLSGATQPTGNTIWNNPAVYEVLDAQATPQSQLNPYTDQQKASLGTYGSQLVTGTPEVKYSAPQPQTGGGYTPGQGKYAGWDPAAEAADRAAKGDFSNYSNTGGSGYDALKGEISSGWDSYLNSLSQQIPMLEQQRQAQENIVGSQIASQLGTAGMQKDQGVRQLEGQRDSVTKNQVKTLRDISASVRNAFLAGNNYLGTRGAGDSSASNQYSFALNKLGTRQRSDVMQQTAGILGNIGTQQFNLEQSYNDQVRNLEATKYQQLQSISSWFSQAQQQLRDAQAQGQLSKDRDLQSVSRQILNDSISALNYVQQESANKRSQLDQWAISISKSPSELAKNLQSVQQYKPALPGYQPVSGQFIVDSGGNMRSNIPVGYGFGNDERIKSIYG